MHSLDLSFVMAGKNDDYAGNFLDRIKFNITKLNKNLQILQKDNVEIIVVDWASDEKLSDTLNIPNLTHVKFLYVPHDVANQVSPDNGFSSVHALNAGYRKSNGKYVFFIDGDSYINLETTKKVVELCENLSKKNEDAYFWASRYHLPYEVHSTCTTINEIDMHINQWNEGGRQGWKREKINLENVVAPMGLLLSRNIADESTCYYEKLNKWGYIEIELFDRLKPNFKCNGDLDNNEDMYFFHLDHHTIGKQGKSNQFNKHEKANSLQANGTNWGLYDYNLQLYQI